MDKDSVFINGRLIDRDKPPSGIAWLLNVIDQKVALHKELLIKAKRRTLLFCYVIDLWLVSVLLLLLQLRSKSKTLPALAHVCVKALTGFNLGALWWPVTLY